MDKKYRPYEAHEPYDMHIGVTILSIFVNEPDI